MTTSRTVAAVNSCAAWMRANPSATPAECSTHMVDTLTEEMFAIEAALAEMTEIAQALRKLHEKPTCTIGEVGAVIARLDRACGK